MTVHTCVHAHLGLCLSVGKTSLLHQYVHKTFYGEYQTTLGASILSKVIILDDTTLKLQVSHPLLYPVYAPKNNLHLHLHSKAQQEQGVGQAELGELQLGSTLFSSPRHSHTHLYPCCLLLYNAEQMDRTETAHPAKPIIFTVWLFAGKKADLIHFLALCGAGRHQAP